MPVETNRTDAEGVGAEPGEVYIASKTVHAARWRALRAKGHPIISTWIDEAGVGETACFTDLWRRCVSEAVRAKAVVVYREPGEILKGAFVEVGAALAVGRPVFAVGCDEFSFVHHALVTRCADLDDALARALATPAPTAPVAVPDDVRRGITLEELQAAHVARQAEWCPDQLPDLSFRGNELAGEAGEASEALILHAAEIGRAAGRASNIVKKLERERHGWRGSRATLQDLADELSDTIHCAILAAITAGIPLGAAVITKFNATSQKQGLRTLLSAPSATRPEAGERNSEFKAKQVTLGSGLVDITVIRHEGKEGVLFRPRPTHIPYGDGGELQEGIYWPTADDVVLWVTGAGPGVAIEHLQMLASPPPVSVSAPTEEGMRDISEDEAVHESERVFAALKAYDEALADGDPNDPEREVHVFDAMKAAIGRAEHLAAHSPFRSGAPTPQGGMTGLRDVMRETVSFRVGGRVPRNVYCGDEPEFMARSDERASELITLLNLGIAALSPDTDTAGREGWQPIETAPKDGTWVALYWPALNSSVAGAEIVAPGCWGDNYKAYTPHWLRYGNYTPGDDPTKWAALQMPAPPVRPSKAEG